MLCGAQNYTNWNGGTFTDGDVVNISYDHTSTPTILNTSINLASGALTATINAGLLKAGTIQNGAMVGNFSNGSINFGSANSNINFDITKQQNATGVTNAFYLNGTTFTAEANLDINITGGITAFQASGGTLTFNGDLEIGGNVSNAFSTTNSTLSINQNGNQKVNIIGAISSNGGTTNIKLDSSDDSINGAISATNGTTKLELSGGSQITGGFTGTGTSNLTLTVDNSTFGGSVNNSGGTNSVTVNNRGSIQGNLTTSGTSLTLNMDNGSITQGVVSTVNQNTAILTSSTITNGLSLTGTTNTVTMSGGSIGGKLTTNGNGTNTVNLSNNATISGGFDAQGNTTLTMDSATINGSSTISGTSFTANTISNSTLGSLTSNANTNTVTMTSSNATGNFSLNGTISNSLTMSDGNITGKLTTKGGGTNQVTLNSQATVSGGFDAQGTTTLGMDNATLNGNSTISGNSFTATLKNSTLGDVTSNATTNTIQVQTGGNTNFTSLTLNGTTNSIFTELDPPMLEIGTLTMTGTNNQAWRLGNGSAGVNLHVTGNATLTANNGGNNTFIFRNGGVDGTLTTSGLTKIGLFNNTSVNTMIHKNGELQLKVAENAIVQNGLTTEATTTQAEIKIENQAQLNGSSTIASTISANVTMTATASGGAFNFQGPQNTLRAEGTNNILTSLTMQGTNGGNTVNTLNITGKLTINGNATLTAGNGGHNDIDFNNGAIAGTLTTSGTTTLDTNHSTSIGQGIRHSNGNIDATFGADSEVSNGIITEGKQGAANITFNNDSKLNGDSSFDNATNQVTLNTSAQVNGNLSFNGGSTLTANNNTSITGQVITNEGIANYGFNDSATVTGGINTEAGATSTTANFNGSSILKDGTSTFHSNIDITFAGSSKAANETFNVQAGTANIKFQDNAQMNGGTITTNGGISNITFQDNSKMINATINTTGGTTNLTAKNSAELSNTFTQSGGDFNATFSESAKFNGNATQTGGDSDIKFNNQSTWTGNFTQHNAVSNSKITFSNTASMTGDITTNNGTTDITFNNGTQITGNIAAQGTDNKVTFNTATLDGNLTLDGLGNIMGNSKGDFTGSTITGNVQGYDRVILNLTGTKVEGFVHQGPSANNSGITGTFTDSQILNGFEGTNSINTLTVRHSDIQNGVTQSGASLKMTTNETTISGGFRGTNNSQNTVDMTKGSLAGGISQTTGSLDFKSQMTDISDGFTGMDSTNTLKMANGSFTNGNIQQVLGSLQGEIIMMSDLGDFGGESSDNILHLSSSKIQSVTQSSGSLELNTNADVEGKITGDRASENKITITGANVLGEISQSFGSMDLTLMNSNAKKTITSTNADFGLYATNATVEGDISLIGSASNGVSDGLTLNGKFTQSNGTSTMTFSNTKFMKKTTISNAVSASLIFSRSTIQDIEATQGITAYNLSDSSMQGFTGNMGQHSITLVKSSATTFNQKGGSIILNASNNSTATSVTGTNFANVAVTLDRSNITEDIINGGETTIAMQDSTIGRNVEQTAGSLSFTASNSTLTGHYKQIDGTSMVNFMNSKINGGIDLKTLDNGTMNFTQKSEITGGVKSVDSRFTFMLLSGSTLNGGFTQDQGQVTGTVDESTLNGGMILSNGSTNFSFYNGSTLNGNIEATDHNTTILIDRSTINGNMTISGGSFDLTAQNGSTVNGNNGAGNQSQVQITNADFKLTLDTGSTFNGDITQTNNNQTIIVKQNSNLNGNITNTDVTSSISVNNATIDGDISQTGGSLTLDLSNNGKVNGDITLTNSNTTLSGSGTGNQIGGNFTQNNGTLGGSMTGLTLNGTFEQTGGISNVSFINSEFKNATTITGATSSSLTFDNSTLKSYTTSGGANNTLKLINDTKMNGTLTLSNGAQTTLTMDSSTITAQNANPAITGLGDSTLTFNTKNSTITGDITFDTGGLEGATDNTDIKGNISLTNTISDVSFTNTSTITGNLTATGTNSNNTINFDNSSITGNVSQTGGAINLDLSNGSGIGGNLTFTNATARLTGSGANNSIGGKFDSNNTTLTGDASGLNLKGTFTQTQGSSDIIFRNDSLFEGKVTLDQGDSNISFIDNSGIRNAIEIKNQNNALVGLQGNSFITGNISVTNTTSATLSAQNNSTITGDITLNNSTTNLNLSNQSSLQGAITQTNGELNISASGRSTLTSNMTLKNGTTSISLSDGSNLTGTITAENNPLSFTLRDNSSYNSLNAPQDISITNANLTITASNNSVFGGNLTHTSNDGKDHSANLTFNSNSFYSGTMSFDNVTVSAKFNQSGIFSDSIEIKGKSALFDFDGATNGGVIQQLTANDTDLSINTANQSHITINDLQITGNALNLKATNSSRLTANVTLDGTTTATYTANTNGNLNVNTKIANQASTLTVDINGGMMQGAITQDPNGNNGFPNGEITLSNGGRWAVTDDTQAKELTLTNTEEQLYSDAIFASAFNSPLSFVDFTLDFADEDTTSRVGKAIIQKPQPQPNQPIPPAPDGSTYVRQLHLNEIKGNNGLFRVYADLGTNLADNILASKASGDHLIQVQYRAETFREIGGDRIVVAKVTDPSTTVSFKGTQSEIGLTKYDTEILKENAQDGNGFEWIIGQATPAGMSYSSKIIASILQSQYRTFAIEIDSLDRRMGDLEFIKRDKGFWIRSFIGSNTKEATDYSTLATDNYYSIWSGFDYNSIGLTVHNYVGVFFNYTGINTESKDYTGKSSNIAFGFYNTFKAFSGFYADILAKYIYTMSEFDISNYSLAKNSPKIDNHKFLLNAEIGYSFYYGEKGKSGYIQPQFQVTSGYIHKTDLSVVDVSGETINATIGRNFPVSIRAGAFWGQVFGEKIKSHIKLGTSFVYDVDSGGVLNFSDSSTELQFKQGSDFRWVLSAATDFTFSEFFKLYASFDTSFFGNYNTTYSANLGIRFTFGRANNYVRNVPMVYSPYTPPVSIDNDKRTVPVVKRYTTKDIDQNYVGKPRRVESYIQGNSNPTIQQGSPTYTPSRQSHRDITSEVEF